ncbi:uncharacterized protein [Clytia hemisphaerica]|uniref:uncharacterized protein n=1 Tax=Clytia hemisphaerica TaxID=252671 RepID=UPI0034D59E07
MSRHNTKTSPNKLLHLFVFLSTLFIQPSHAQERVTTKDFYPHGSGAVLLESNNKEIFTTGGIKYPHWSNQDNAVISIVESGIIRLGSFEGINTCDVLVLATAQPIDKGNGIRYEEVITPTQNQRDLIQADLSSTQDLKTFAPTSFFMATWNEVEFYSNAKSSFQVVLVTNGTSTIAIIKIVDMQIPSWQLLFYPELDVRYAYDQGTTFKRSRFLQKQTNGPKSGTIQTAPASNAYSNTNLNGRWIINLSIDPDKQQGGGSQINATFAPVVDERVKRGSQIAEVGVAGKFVFDKLTLDGNVVTQPGDNNEISVILSKKDKRFNTMDTNIINWLSTVYAKASGNVSPAKVTIIDYKPGSLVVEYSVEIPEEVCGTKSRPECIKTVETTVTKEANNITESNIEATLDQKRTEFTDLDECSVDSSRGDKLFCDQNAYCYNFPGEGSYACICKDGYEGSGRVGQCNLIKDTAKKTIGIIAGVIIALLLLIFVFVFVIKREQNERLREKQIEAERIIPRDMRPRKSMMKPKDRSTRRVLVRAGEFGSDFDVYHRT